MTTSKLIALVYILTVTAYISHLKCMYMVKTICFISWMLMIVSFAMCPFVFSLSNKTASLYFKTEVEIWFIATFAALLCCLFWLFMLFFISLHLPYSWSCYFCSVCLWSHFVGFQPQPLWSLAPCDVCNCQYTPTCAFLPVLINNAKWIVYVAVRQQRHFWCGVSSEQFSRKCNNTKL